MFAARPGPAPSSITRTWSSGRTAWAVTVVLALALASAPTVWTRPTAAGTALGAALCLAGGASILAPRAGAATVGVLLSLALALPGAGVGLGVLACPVALASCAAARRGPWPAVIALWSAVILLVATVQTAPSLVDVLIGGAVWTLLLGTAVVVGTRLRRFADQAQETARQRERDLEEQRRALARELHDSAVRATTEIALLAERARRREPSVQALDAELATIAARAREATEDLRAFMDGLRQQPPIVRAAPLDPAAVSLSPVLGSARRRLEEAGHAVSLGAELGSPVSVALRDVLAVCLAELVANAVRHGDPAEAVTLLAEVTAERAELYVMNRIAAPGPAPPRGGAGLIGVRERLGPCGGTLRTSSDGTHFHAHLSAPREVP